MTKEEAKKMLTNTKVYVNGKSNEIQEKLFEIGLEWFGHKGNAILHVDSPFLYLTGDITYNESMLFFKDSPLKEISADDILNIKLGEEPFPKNGDILFIKEKYFNEPLISIFNKIENKSVYTYIDFIFKTGTFSALDLSEYYLCYVNGIDVLRLATKEEKELLFNALKEKGLKWNDETKEVETIEQPKKEYIFKPFDKVLVRDFEDDKWEIDLFEKINDDDEEFTFNCLFANWTFCIPYEGNEELFDTSNSAKE